MYQLKGFVEENSISNFLKKFSISWTYMIKDILIPVQRIDRLKTFFFLSLLFLQRTDQIPKTDRTYVDDTLKPLLKHSLVLPSNAANEYLYGSREDGFVDTDFLEDRRFGIPLAAGYSGIALTDGWFKLMVQINGSN